MSTNYQRLRVPFKWHGSKQGLAPWIIARMPPHRTYVEPYAGSLGVLLARDPDDPSLWLSPHKGVREVVNDLDRRLFTFWEVLRDPALRHEFFIRAQATPPSPVLFEEAKGHTYGGPDRVDDALALFVVCRQSMSGRGDCYSRSPGRLRRKMDETASSWQTAVKGLPRVWARVSRVVLYCEPALDVIRREDGPGTLFYCDPPYLHETRAGLVYGHEMTETDHRELLDTLLRCRGKVMLSGNPSVLYDDTLRGWTRHTKQVKNHGASGKTKAVRTEVLWCNFH